MLRWSSGFCVECLQCLQRRSASTASGTSNAAAGPSSRKYEPPAAGYRPRPSSLQKDWRSNGPSTSSRLSNPLPASNGPLRRPPAGFIENRTAQDAKPRQNAIPSKSSKTDYFVEKPIKKTVNFAQGSALAAFMNRAQKPAPSDGTVDNAQRSKTSSVQKIAATPTKSLGRLPRRSSHPKKKLSISNVTSVATLAKQMDLKLRRLQLLMERMGMIDTRPDLLLNAEDASLVCSELGFEVSVDDRSAFDIYPAPIPKNMSSQPLRPPIVTIMGHVDHGKTSLLDALRSTKVAAGEAGGITQHIGAFNVSLSSLVGVKTSETDITSASTSTPESITFLDTPGHAAFTAMRSRGASITDVVILVVAADDGVRPQTEEVIKLIQHEDVGIVVAITKCDKSAVDIARVQNDLLVQGLEVEQLGGDIPCVQVSAHKKTGLAELVETVNAIAEVRDLRAETSGIPSEGRVIESRKDIGRGNIATVIVTRGTLRPGATIVAGTSFAKVRVLTSSDGTNLSEASPGTPVEVTGWKELPEAGDAVIESIDEETAKRAIETRKRKEERRKTVGDVEVINEKRKLEAEALALAKQMSQEADSRSAENRQSNILASLRTQTSTGPKELRLVVKADFSGTVEAVTGALSEIGNNEAIVKIIESGVGDVNDGDLALAKAVDGIIVGFNIKASRTATAAASSLGVPLVINDVIYRLIDEIKSRLIELLPKLYDTRVVGEATVQQVFQYKLKGADAKAIAGCRVTNGSLQRKAKIRVMRERAIVYEGEVESLKHVKENIDEARKGSECGLQVLNFEQFQEGDTVQSYEQTERIRTL